MQKKNFSFLLASVICCGIAFNTACGGGKTESAGSEDNSDYSAVESVTPPPSIEEGAFIRVDEKTALFGNYPQSQVTDTALLETLNSISDTPTANPDGWTSFDYFYKMSEVDLTIAYYSDVEFGGERYRGCYFANNRPLFTSDRRCPAVGYTTSNGFILNSIYWFKYEAIEWEIVAEQEGTATLFSKRILDAVHFFNGKDDRTVEGQSVHANNYEHSDIRVWLNDYFYNLAFGEEQKNLLQISEVDNSAATLDREDSYRCACPNTQDKVYLPSYGDIASNFGYSNAQERKRETSAYSMIIGARKLVEEDKNYGAYTTRSPYVYPQMENSTEHLLSNRRAIVGWDGNFEYDTGDNQVAASAIGVCPMVTVTTSNGK